ncbi:MAG: GGDEF domain-containing protein [Clostridiales bacterium]|nr:GGDEF domain-containing protein [Clostridiales bacterium]
MKFFIDGNESKEMRERVQRIAIADSLGPSRLSLCLIAVLELYFLVTWLIFDRSFTDVRELRYFLCYLSLLSFAVVAFILSFVFERDLVNGYKKLTVLQAIAAVVLLIWAVLVTIFDSDHHTEFSYIVYATIIVVLPAVIYVNRSLLNIMYLLCDVVLVVFTVIIKPDNFLSTILNFIVFAIVSLCACNLYKGTKFTSIKREIELQDLAERDHLTGLYNRQKLNAISQSIMDENREAKTELSCVMADIDDFKMINDRYGHSTGDKVLEDVASIVQEVAGQNGGQTFRYGGEEFLIIFSDCSSRQACNVVEKIQDKMKGGIRALEEYVSLSFGVYTAVPTASDKIEQYYSAADDLLYTSKKSGKDRYTAFEEPTYTYQSEVSMSH